MIDPRSLRPLAVALLWLSVGMLVTGCGFRLRSYNLEAGVESYAMTGQVQSRVAQPLRQGLKQAGVPEAESPAQAEMIIELLDQRVERRSASTGRNARATEYEMTIGVQFALTDGAGNELAPARWIERGRVFRIDRENIVGASEEQAILEREMVQDLVGQIIRAMDAVSRSSLAAIDAS